MLENRRINTIFLQHNDAYDHRSLRFTSIKELSAVRWWTFSPKRTLIICSNKTRNSGSAKLAFRSLSPAKCSIKGCSIQNVSNGDALTLTHWTSKSWCFSSDDRNREFKCASGKELYKQQKDWTKRNNLHSDTQRNAWIFKSYVCWN